MTVKKAGNMLIYNALRTPDGTVMESRSRYDCKIHIDSITLKEYMIDGGLDYVRRSVWGDEIPMHIFYEEASHEVRARFMLWGTRGVNGDQPLRKISISSMSTEHIKACLDTQHQMREEYKETMRTEFLRRND